MCTDCSGKKKKTVEAHAAENLLQNVKDIPKLASQSLGETRPYSSYVYNAQESVWVVAPELVSGAIKIKQAPSYSDSIC